jgi:hypothetical protein
MKAKSLDEIAKITQAYDITATECDGLTLMLHRVLLDRNIDHSVRVGGVTHIPSDAYLAPHLWIQAPIENFGIATVDFRLRYTLRLNGIDFVETGADSVPHGVFLASSYPAILYTGYETDMQRIDDTLFSALCVTRNEQERIFRAARQAATQKE